MNYALYSLIPLIIALLSNSETFSMLSTVGYDQNLIEITQDFQKACESGSLRQIKILVEKGADATAVRSNGETSLHLAARNPQGGANLIKFLMRKGCLLDAQAEQNLTPFHHACKKGTCEMVKAFIKKGSDIKAVGINGETALHQAALNPDKSVIELLISRGCQLHACTNNNQRPLHWACAYGTHETVRILIVHGAHTDVTTQEGLTPLHLATNNTHASIMRLLVQNQCKVDDRAQDNVTPLHYACKNGSSVQIVQALLELGSHCHAVTIQGDTPLHLAVQGNDDRFTRLVQTLLTHGADADAQNLCGQTPLHKATALGNCERVKILAEAGARIDLQDNNGHTAFHIAVIHEKQQCLSLLCEIAENTLSKKCDYDAALDIVNRTLGHFVRRVSMGLQSALDITDRAGQTALHLAVQRGLLGITEMLLRHKACQDIKDSAYLIPRDSAQQCGDQNLLDMYSRPSESLDSSPQRSTSSSTSSEGEQQEITPYTGLANNSSEQSALCTIIPSAAFMRYLFPTEIVNAKRSIELQRLFKNLTKDQAILLTTFEEILTRNDGTFGKLIATPALWHIFTSLPHELQGKLLPHVTVPPVESSLRKLVGQDIKRNVVPIKNHKDRK